MREAANISVVILSHNRVEELLRTVALTLALPEQPAVIVVDNGSGDGSASRVAQQFPAVRVLALSRNIGAAARNFGARAADTEYVAFSDDDTVWTAGSLSAATHVLRDHPRIGVVTARILVGEQRREDPACQVMAASPLPSAGRAGRSVAGFMAGACVFRRRAFEECGGYEPRLFIGGEEGLLALDLAARGWSMIYSDVLTVYHYPSKYRDITARKRMLIRNALWVGWLRRHPAAAMRITLAALLRGARDPSALAGCFDALKGISWVMRQRRVVPDDVESSWRQIERWLADNTGSPRVPAASGAGEA